MRPQNPVRFRGWVIVVVDRSLGGRVDVWSAEKSGALIDEQEFVPIHDRHAIQLNRSLTSDAMLGLEFLDQRRAIVNLLLGRLA